jgi:hypothetical protein
MPKKDKRIKACPNSNCPDSQTRKKYKADDTFCTKCGSRLIFVCAECFKEIEDEPGHKFCMNCEAKKKHDGGIIQHKVKKIGEKTKEAINSGAVKAGQKIKQGALVVKAKAPQGLRLLKEGAKNPKVQQAAVVVADAALRNVRNSKVKRLGKDLIKVVKK